MNKSTHTAGFRPCTPFSQTSLYFSFFRLPASVWLTRSHWWSATRCCRSLPLLWRGRCCWWSRIRRIWSYTWRRIATLACRGLVCRVALNASWRLAHTWWSSRGGQALNYESTEPLFNIKYTSLVVVGLMFDFCFVTLSNEELICFKCKIREGWCPTSVGSLFKM